VPVPLSEMPMIGTSFWLSYHGEDNRALQELLASAMVRACPALLWEAPHVRAGARREGRLRVGFVSKFMRQHSIGRTTRGLVAELSRERFEVYALFVAPLVDDTISQFIRERADESVVLPGELEAARRRIADLQLDVLFYQDIGMEPFTYALAFSRLAPVQCVSFGHPETTGIPAMDYFVSSDLFEPEGAQAHYSERLHLIEGVGTLAYYYRPQLEQPAKGREQFGLGQSEHIYLCPQMLFKVHPEFDELVGGILRADPAGRVVFVEGKYSSWAEALRRRFAQRIGDVAERIVFVPRQATADFLNLIAVADVMLDTIHFNGMNTSLEAFAVGTPVVTLPKAFQRGRHTQGMYRCMGLSECVAKDEADYVAIAVRLGTDAAYREQVRQRILERSQVLYEDRAVVAGFERFFEQACASAQRSPRFAFRFRGA
jgi:protein O-GlcNAc transferase